MSYLYIDIKSDFYGTARLIAVGYVLSEKSPETLSIQNTPNLINSASHDKRFPMRVYPIRSHSISIQICLAQIGIMRFPPLIRSCGMDWTEGYVRCPITASGAKYR